MVELIIILSFPLILAVGYSMFYASLAFMTGGKGVLRAQSYGFYLYPVLLCIPFTFCLVGLDKVGGLERAGVQVPGFAGLGMPVSILGFVTVGLVTGFALYAFELITTFFINTKILKAVGDHPLISGGEKRFQDGFNWTLFSIMNMVMVLVVIMEEVVWRAFLISYLTDSMRVSGIVAAAISAVAFSLNHYYFGIRNVVFKAVHGFVWGLLFVGSGTVLIPIISHYVFDYFSLRGTRNGSIHN